MIGILRGIIGLILAILIVAFAIANRQDVDIVWSPAHPALHTSLYIVALGLLAIGFVLGATMTWFYSLPVRFEKRKQKRQIRILEKELGAAKETTKVIEDTSDWTSLPAKLSE